MDLLNARRIEAPLTRILVELYEARASLDLAASSARPNDQFATLDVGARRASLLGYAIYTVNLFAFNSVPFCQRFIEAGGLRAHMLFLADEAFVRANLNTHLKVIFKFY